MRNEKQWTNKEFRWESSRLRDISAKFSELYRYFSWEMKNSEQTRNFGESLVDYVIFQRNSVSFTGIFREKWKTVNKQGISLGKRKKVSWSGKKWDFRKISWDDKWGPNFFPQWCKFLPYWCILVQIFYWTGAPCWDWWHFTVWASGLH